jgi:hypothetical protein
MHMHVRFNYSAGDPCRIRDVVKYLEEDARPLVEDMPGSVGFSALVNSVLGVAVVQTFWSSDDARRESEKAVAPIRHEMALRGTATVSIEYPQVASFIQLIRPPTGAGVQLTRMNTPPSAMDDAIAGYEDLTVPWLGGTSGFCGQLLFVERGLGRSISETVWRDAQALAASRSAAAAIRVEAAAATNSEIRSLEEYCLVFSSIRSLSLR